MNSTLEELIIGAFIAPPRRARWVASLGSAKRRHKFLGRLNHCRDLDPRYFQAMPSTIDVARSLRNLGAPAMCYVISDIAALDGRELPLDQTVTAAELGGWGTLLSCIPGQLGFYFDEAGTQRRLLLVRDEARATPRKSSRS